MLHVNYAQWLQSSFWISNLHQKHFVYYLLLVLHLKLHYFCSFKDKCILTFFSDSVLCQGRISIYVLAYVQLPGISDSGGHLRFVSYKNYLIVNLPPMLFMKCPVLHSGPCVQLQGSPKQHLAVLHLHPDKLVQNALTGVRLYVRPTIMIRKLFKN